VVQEAKDRTGQEKGGGCYYPVIFDYVLRNGQPEEQQRNKPGKRDRLKQYVTYLHAFYQAANGVWLTDHVPPGDLSGWPG
jgi:hypothetical protein